MNTLQQYRIKWSIYIILEVGSMVGQRGLRICYQATLNSMDIQSTNEIYILIFCDYSIQELGVWNALTAVLNTIQHLRVQFALIVDIVTIVEISVAFIMTCKVSYTNHVKYKTRRGWITTVGELLLGCSWNYANTPGLMCSILIKTLKSSGIILNNSTPQKWTPLLWKTLFTYDRGYIHRDGNGDTGKISVFNQSTRDCHSC